MGRKKYTDEMLREAVRVSKSVAGVMRFLGFSTIAGGSHAHLSKRIRSLGLDTSHFTGRGWNRGNISPDRLSADDLLVLDRCGDGRKEHAYRLRRALDERGIAKICARCGLGESWNGEFLRLELNHIDENSINNVQENLEYLCPNCHSQVTLAAIARRHTGA